MCVSELACLQSIELQLQNNTTEIENVNTAVQVLQLQMEQEFGDNLPEMFEYSIPYSTTIGSATADVRVQYTYTLGDIMVSLLLLLGLLVYFFSTMFRAIRGLNV